MIHLRLSIAIALCSFWGLSVSLGQGSRAAEFPSASANTPTNNDRQATPNFLVILVDDLGAGDLGCQGADDLQTPEIDRLFARSLAFDRFYANSCVCSPTRASLLTGRYPDRAGVPGVIRTHRDNNWGYLADVPTLPNRLSAAGYHSSIVGKWHLGLSEGSTPLDRGFDRFRGFLGDMMDDYYTHLRHGENYMRVDGATITAEGHATDLFTEWACDELGARAEGDAPFLMYLAFNAPHTPVQPPADWLEKIEARMPDAKPERQRLVALIEHLDSAIGKVLKTLEQQGLADSTVVIFTSDNGGQLDAGAFNGNLRDGKQSMYEGGLRVPCAIHWPGLTRSGSRTQVPAMTTDLFATICEGAGQDRGDDLDGRSLMPLLQGQSMEELEEREMYFVRREGGDRYAGQAIYALIRGDWKLVQNSPFGPRELFNLREDPTEQNDLAQKNPQMVRELAQALAVHLQEGGEVPWQAPTRN